MFNVYMDTHLRSASNLFLLPDFEIYRQNAVKSPKIGKNSEIQDTRMFTVHPWLTYYAVTATLYVPSLIISVFQCAVTALCALSVRPSGCCCALTTLSIRLQLNHWPCVACINRASCDLSGSVYFLSSLCMHHAQEVFCQKREGLRQGSRKDISSKLSITISMVAQSSPIWACSQLPWGRPTRGE